MFGLGKPLLCVFAIIGAGWCVTCVVQLAATGTDAAGRPLDWAGDLLKCQRCGGVLVQQRGYNYRCRTCGAADRVWRCGDGPCFESLGERR